MSIEKLDGLIAALKGKPKKRLVIAAPNDSHSIVAAAMAVQQDIVKATLVGNEKIIVEICHQQSINPTNFTIIDEPDETLAATKSVEMIRTGVGDVLMKGLLSTDKYMRAVLNKETGIVSPKATLAHVCVLQIPTYHKLLVVSDIAVIPAPDLRQKQVMLTYLYRATKLLGIEVPKIAIIAATEQMLPGMQACVEAAILSKMSDRGQYPDCIIDGPLAVDVAIEPEACRIKKLDSPVAGDADAMLFHNIESANAFFKAVTKFAKADLAGIVMGAQAPCVLTSRGDTTQTKMYSIALGALLVK